MARCRRGPARAVRPCLAACLAAVLWAGAARADDLPLWEVGAGVGVIDFPHYRGSDQYSTYVLPVPYVVYRGDVLKIDRDSIRGQLFEAGDTTLDLSVNGSTPVRSGDDSTRSGMPNLDPSVEFGPALDVTLARSTGDRFKLDFRLPVRTVVATNLRSAHDIGWLSQPNLNLDVADVFGANGPRLGILAGPLFATRRYDDYFYGVAPAYATPERPAYTAHGGYAGSQIIAALSRRFGNTWAGGFIKWDDLHGATFDPSPLVKRQTFFTGGFAISYIFAVSAERVAADR